MTAYVRSFYVSQDVARDADGSNFHVLDTWSVYSELYDDPEGEPIDGSQRLVSTLPSEHEAEAEAHRLYVADRAR
jgi:hypothetical protein